MFFGYLIKRLLITSKSSINIFYLTPQKTNLNTSHPYPTHNVIKRGAKSRAGFKAAPQLCDH